jgi:hypothetical protein
VTDDVYVPGCTGKRKYRFRSDAKTARNRLKPRKLHVYHCLACQHYHLTSTGESRAVIQERRERSGS